MRIDKLLWFLRFARTRSLAQKWLGEGHIRRNGVRVERSGHQVGVGDILTLPLRQGILVIELTALPDRRGPAQEARQYYRMLDGTENFAIAPAERHLPEEELRP